MTVNNKYINKFTLPINNKAGFLKIVQLWSLFDCLVIDRQGQGLGRYRRFRQTFAGPKKFHPELTSFHPH